MPYRFTGYQKFLDPDGYPAVAPPWGTLSAIDLNTGESRVADSARRIPRAGGEGADATPAPRTTAGPVVTAGGLVFIAATNFDRKFRAFDKATGALLWETTLPFSGNATPATYEVDGRQYVVIAAGGGKGGPDARIRRHLRRVRAPEGVRTLNRRLRLVAGRQRPRTKWTAVADRSCARPTPV